MSRKLSRTEAHRLALHYAISERDSFADCHHREDPEYARATNLANELRRVLMEEFGEKTWEDEFRDQNHPSISIHDIKPTEAETDSVGMEARQSRNEQKPISKTEEKT